MDNKGRFSHHRQAFTALALFGLTACGGSGFSNETVQVPTQAVDIDVPSAVVTPVYTLTSSILPAGFPISEYNDGNFVLRSATEQDDTAVLGASHESNPAAVRVVQGRYDVLYRHETGADVPQNVDTPIQTDVDINSDLAPFAVALTAWSVTPSFSHNAGADTFPASEYDDAVFYLQPAAGGERIFLGNSHTASADPVQVLAGSYGVIYALETGGELVPGNQNAVVGTLTIDNDTAPVIDVSSVRFQFRATLDSQNFQPSQYQHAKFYLRNNAGDRVELGASYELAGGQPVTQLMIPGTYDIVYQYVQGDTLPVNRDAVIAKDVEIDAGNPSVALDIQSVAINPSFTLNQGRFPASEYDAANFYLRSVNNADDVMFIGASEVAPEPVRVISSAMDTDVNGAGVLFGGYEVLYRHETGAAVPQNSNAVVASQVLDTDVSLLVDVPMVEATGRFTLNGKAFPTGTGDSVRFLLRDSSNASDECLLGFSELSNEAVKIIPGTYDVVMDHLAGDGVPQNEMHEVDFNIDLTAAATTFTVDVPAVQVVANFTLDGAAFPASIYQSAVFYLRDLHGGGRIFLGYSYKDNEPVMVIKEDHQVVYEHLNGELTPQNTNSVIQVVDL